jgi:hypothetical protein
MTLEKKTTLQNRTIREKLQVCRPVRRESTALRLPRVSGPFKAHIPQQEEAKWH